MRSLSKEEKELCRRMLKGSGENNFFSNIIHPELDKICISINRNAREAILEISINNNVNTEIQYDVIKNKINQFSFYILTAVNLIQLLEKEGYILLTSRASRIDNESKFGGCVKNSDVVTHKIPDKVVTELLIEYTDKEILATSAFENFCNRNFTSRDEQRYKRQIFISTAALTVTTMALLFNTIFPKLTGTKINQHQIDTLVSSIKSIENKINSQIITNRNNSKDSILKITKGDTLRSSAKNNIPK